MLLDVLQFGLPVVASNVGGIPGIIGDGVNGLLVEPEDTDGLFSALASIIDNDELRDGMRRRNIERAKNYTASAMADAYERLYQSL